VPRDPLLRCSEHVAEFGTREFTKAQRAHEEGVIAKRAAGLRFGPPQAYRFKARVVAVIDYIKSLQHHNKGDADSGQGRSLKLIGDKTRQEQTGRASFLQRESLAGF
jgi:hypothetical protein